MTDLLDRLKATFADRYAIQLPPRGASPLVSMSLSATGEPEERRDQGGVLHRVDAPVPKYTTPASDDASRRTVLRAVRIGLWVWPSFTALDAYMCFVAFPGAPFPLFLAYRAAVELAFVGVRRMARKGIASTPQLFRGLNLTFGSCALAISLMAVHLGGIESPYMHGLSIVALVRAALVPTQWRRALPTFLRIALAFPLVMALGAALSPAARMSWLTQPALIVFASNYVFVVASAFLGLLSGDIMWRTQQQLYRERRVGRYRLQAPIGKGGMGEVWLAWDISLQRNVALKLLRVEASHPDFLKRFEREARAASKLEGPHVVRIFDFGASDDGLYYLAMEYLVGMDLARLVATFGPLPEARAVGFMTQACRALAEAHAAGIIHRDIKPHNLYVTRVGDEYDFLKLLDFGVVRLRAPEAEHESLTWTGILVGTPAYVAPELWKGGAADERSDIYALGITLAFLLTGQTPNHSGQSGVAQAPSVSRISNDHLAEIVFRCVAESPELRIQTVRDLEAMLTSVPLPTPWTRADAEAFWNQADRARLH